MEHVLSFCRQNDLNFKVYLEVDLEIETHSHTRGSKNPISDLYLLFTNYSLKIKHIKQNISELSLLSEIHYKSELHCSFSSFGAWKATLA